MSNHANPIGHPDPYGILEKGCIWIFILGIAWFGKWVAVGRNPCLTIFDFEVKWAEEPPQNMCFVPNGVYFSIYDWGAIINRHYVYPI